MSEQLGEQGMGGPAGLIAPMQQAAQPHCMLCWADTLQAAKELQRTQCQL